MYTRPHQDKLPEVVTYFRSENALSEALAAPVLRVHQRRPTEERARRPAFSFAGDLRRGEARRRGQVATDALPGLPEWMVLSRKGANGTMLQSPVIVEFPPGFHLCNSSTLFRVREERSRMDHPSSGENSQLGVVRGDVLNATESLKSKTCGTQIAAQGVSSCGDSRYSHPMRHCVDHTTTCFWRGLL